MNPYAINPVLLPAAQKIKSPENKPDVPMMEEISWSEQDVLQSYLPFSNNPDPVVRAKSLKIYNEMYQDDQIKVCVDIRNQSRLSSGYEIKPGKENDAYAQKMADFIKFILKRMSGNFETNLEEIYTAVGFGFSITEKVFDYIETGPAEWKGMIGLRALKTREPYYYDFKIDAHGNPLGIVYTGTHPNMSINVNSPYLVQDSFGRLIMNPGGVPASNINFGTFDNPFPMEKFVVYSYNQRFGNQYGRSDFLAAFKWWMMKKHGSKFWAIWLERYASPFIWAQYKRDAGLKKKALDRIDDFIRNLSVRNGVRVSDAVELKSIEFSGTGANAYEDSIEAYNRYIAHALLFPNLLGFTGSQGSGMSGGTYGLGQKHFDAFLWVLNKMGRDTSETIVGEQIIKPLIQLNFGEDDEELYPKFQFLSVDAEDIDLKTQSMARLAQYGLIDPNEDWVRDYMTLPKKDPDIVLGLNNKVLNPQDSNAPNAPNVQDPNAEDPNKKTNEMKNKKFKKRENFDAKLGAKKFTENLDLVEKMIADEATVELELLRDKIIETVKRKKIVVDEDSAEAGRITINVSGLRDIFSKWLIKIRLDSALKAFEELGDSGVSIEVTRKFQTFAEKTPFESWQPLPPKDAIDFFRKKVNAKIINEDGVKTVIDIASGVDLSFARNKAFAIAGVMRDDILNDAKQVILNGIKRHDEIGTVKDLKDIFNKYIQQGVAVDGDLIKTSRLNTIVRTNVSEAVNEGRASMMTDPDVEGFVQFWQYTAIIDDRTTDYCDCMDQKIFRIEDLPMLKPPAHFNCRSFSVPITKFEIQDMQASGHGVEISDPCMDRAVGFADIKRDPVAVLNPQMTGISVPASDINSIIDQIKMCPYTYCHAENPIFQKRMFNVNEFSCVSCKLPFRVSDMGDLYLYDAGEEKYKRVSIGINPVYFKSNG